MILPVLDQEFRPFVVSAGYSHVVLLLRFVEVGESPVDDPEIAGLVVDDDVEGFNIAMHDSVGVGVVEGLEDLVDIQSDVHVVEAPHQLLGLNVRDILEHQTRRLGTFLADHVVHANDVRASVQVLENLRFAVDFFRSYRLQNLDNAFLVILKA